MMMKHLLLCAALIPSLAAANERLYVEGKIPSDSCQPYSSGDLFFNVISRGETGVTSLSRKNSSIVVECPAATSFTWRLVDARADSVVKDLAQWAPDRAQLLGLGAHKGHNIGAYWLKIYRATANGGGGVSPVDVFIGSSESGTSGSFKFEAAGSGYLAPGLYYASSFEERATSPSAVKRSTISLEFGGVLAPMAGLEGEEAKIDGLATIELVLL